MQIQRIVVKIGVIYGAIGEIGMCHCAAPPGVMVMVLHQVIAQPIELVCGYVPAGQGARD
jgi:hypothetical protein